MLVQVMDKLSSTLWIPENKVRKDLICQCNVVSRYLNEGQIKRLNFGDDTVRYRCCKCVHCWQDCLRGCHEQIERLVIKNNASEISAEPNLSTSGDKLSEDSRPSPSLNGGKTAAAFTPTDVMDVVLK
jgi:hypothetical protein